MKVAIISSLIFALVAVAAPAPEKDAPLDKRQYSYGYYYYPVAGSCVEGYGACNSIYPPCCEGPCEIIAGEMYGYCNPGAVA